MTIYTKTITVASALAFLISASTALAEAPPPGSPGMMKPTVHLMDSTSTEHMRSSTERKGDGSLAARGEWRNVPGIVTALTHTGFIMSSRGNGNEHASTTIVVIVTSDTRFDNPGFMMHAIAPPTHPTTTSSSIAPRPREPGGVSAIVVGSKVEVLGKIATSTNNTITAQIIRINRGSMDDTAPKIQRGHMDTASGSPTSTPEKEGFFLKVKGFFGGDKQGVTSTTGGPAAASSSGFVSALMDILFGWLH